MHRILAKSPFTDRNELICLSDEEHEAYRALMKQDCSHPTTELRERIVAKDGRQHVHQCTICGLAASRALKRDDSLALPSWDQGAWSGWRDAIERQRRTFLTEVFQRQMSEDRRVNWEYRDYLLSERWRSKRGLVLERDGHVCQGCRQQTATQVHHLTYHNLFDEFLFELVSVCDDCHDRLHADNAGETAGAVDYRQDDDA